MKNRSKLPYRTALITGAALRVGRACALALAERGVNVVLHCHRSRREAGALRVELEALGARSWIVAGDLSRPATAEAVFRAAVGRAGAIDLLVNNASIYEEGRLMDLRLPDLRRHLNINALAPFLLGRAFAAQKTGGTIVNFLDARIVRSGSRHAAYHLSKCLLTTLTRMMAVEFAPRVRVNAVAPGAILPPEGASRGYLRQVARANLLGRFGALDDVAQAVLYLAGARFVTGQILYVDGGYHLRGDLHD